jgi:uncharacterized protein YpmB
MSNDAIVAIILGVVVAVMVLKVYRFMANEQPPDTHETRTEREDEAGL